MDFNRDDFLILLLRQLENCTTWDEDRYIDRILHKYNSARQLKEDVAETFPLQAQKHPYFVSDAARLVVVKSRDSVELMRAAPQHPRKRRYLNIAAAVLVAVATAGSLFLFSSDDRSMAGVAAKGVILQLAKGETVRLGDGVETITTSYALLNINSAMLRFQSMPGAKSDAQHTITVPAAHMYSVTLADGTVVHMNAATSLRFPFVFDGSRREVYVDGEAYFSVAHDPRHPFIVHTKQGDVNVLGTDFNVNTYGNNFVVSLVSGSVVVLPKHGVPKQVKPCEETVLDPVSLELSLKEFKSEIALGWMHGQYRFHLQPLKEVCKIAERLYGVKIRLDGDLAELRYTGIISRKEPVGVFLEKLRDNGKVNEYYYDEDGVIHLILKKSNADKLRKL